ncbi:glucan endo-1,3-beta-glucosidase 12 [Carica papaya]|uniref:glucan endo-1,3-beta-glucosidase 12 n=1 Tax=Carica papaya TaxID=3649 RepID=UPI000B8C76EA|nr:glucan endo-1,3-beta-glucosidase 12 [Carica papaya]
MSLSSSLLILSLLCTFQGTTSLPKIGVTYSSPSVPTTVRTIISTSPPPAADQPPSPDRIAAVINNLGLPAVRLPDSDPSMVRAFSYTNTSLLLSIPNLLVPLLAANRSLALRWVYRHVLPFHPRSKISLISVGNDAVSSSPDVSSYLLPAVRNLHLALRDLGIRKVPVSSTFSFFSTITTAFPPSSALFQQPVGDLIIKPLLQFLEDTNSSFLINIYPYNMYRLNAEIPIGFALFQEHPFNFRDDLITGVRYRNLFDMMVDAVISAMAVAGYQNVPVVVAETGWPSSSPDPGEVDATPFYAEMYLKGLVGHLRSGLGTPLRKEGITEAYIYELVDKDWKQGTRNWGILYQNTTKKYNIEYSGVSRIGWFRGILIAIFLMGLF